MSEDTDGATAIDSVWARGRVEEVRNTKTEQLCNKIADAILEEADQRSCDFAFPAEANDGVTEERGPLDDQAKTAGHWHGSWRCRRT